MPVAQQVVDLTPGLTLEQANTQAARAVLVGQGKDTTAVDAHLANIATQITAAANLQTILTAAANALSANATYIAIASPTAPQVATQVAALTRQMNGVIRLLLNQLDATT